MAIRVRDVAEIARPARAALTLALLRSEAWARSVAAQLRRAISNRRRTRCNKTLIAITCRRTPGGVTRPVRRALSDHTDKANTRASLIASRRPPTQSGCTAQHHRDIQAAMHEGKGREQIQRVVLTDMPDDLRLVSFGISEG